ncbi:MAG TPA: phosphate acetyltransferase [Candidatus Atribacteria bacterium]|nr:phosphate acetyltransferase [Candidatus Atribacteria bacterium]
MGVLDKIREKAKVLKKRIALPESQDERVLKAAEISQREGIASVVLLGEEETIAQKARELHLDLSGVEIVNHLKDEKREFYIDDLYQLRKNKGLSREGAEDLLKSPMYYACMMLRENRVDGIVGGAVLSSPDVIRPALQIIKTAPGIKLASSCFLMVVPDCSYGENGAFLYADSGLNPNPDAEELAHIAITTARTAVFLLDAEPRVAMLSFSTKGSAQHELVDKVIEATNIAHSLNPDLLLDGELQGDAALSPEVAEMKAPGSPVAGKANVLIFPDLNSGNISYKLTQYLAKATAIGPILQGLAKPVNDLSRGAKVEDIVDQIAVTVLQTQF